MPEKSKVRFDISDDEMDQILEEPAVLPRDIVTVNIDNDTDEEEEEEEPKAGNEFLRAITLDHSYTELDKATWYILNKEDPLQIPRKPKNHS